MSNLSVFKDVVPRIPILEEVKEDFQATPEWRRDFWGMVFRRNDIQEFRDIRIHVAYRVTRFLLHATSSIDLNEQIREEHVSQVMPCPNMPQELQDLFQRGDLALTPLMMKDYDLFLDMFLWGARESGAVFGTVEFPHMFSVAMCGATNKNLKAFYPTPREIVNYEQELLCIASEKLVDKGQIEVLRYFQKEGGFSEEEVAIILRMCKKRNRMFLDDDIEDSRATMIMRLEAAVVRARKSLDLRAELAALKMLSTTMGLDKVERPGELDQMVDVIRSIATAKEKTKPKATIVDAEFK